MEMHIKENVIKSYRNDKAWSQTHLAEVAGLSLRTIQRIEKTNSASLESIKAIAAAFDVEVIDLKAESLRKKPNLGVKTKIASLIAASALTASTLFTMKATATPIMVDLLITSQGETLADVQVLNEENIFNQVEISDKLKVELASSKLEAGVVKISTFIYDLSSGNAKLISAPSVSVEHQKTAEIHVGKYKLYLKPDLQE